jgi:hypothetical protein
MSPAQEVNVQANHIAHREALSIARVRRIARTDSHPFLVKPIIQQLEEQSRLERAQPIRLEVVSTLAKR